MKFPIPCHKSAVHCVAYAYTAVIWAGNQNNHHNFDLSLLLKKLWLICMGMKPFQNGGLKETEIFKTFNSQKKILKISWIALVLIFSYHQHLKAKLGKYFVQLIFLNFEWCEHMKPWKAPAVLSTIYLISIAAAFLKSNANNSSNMNSNSMWQCTMEKVKSWIKLPYYNVFRYGMITLFEGTLLIIIGYHNPWMHYYR